MSILTFVEAERLMKICYHFYINAAIANAPAFDVVLVGRFELRA